MNAIWVIVIVNVSVAVAPLSSVTVTVYVVAAWAAAVAVPLIAPVVPLRERPEGNAGLIVYALVPAPPATIGVTVVIATLRIAVMFEYVVVNDGAATAVIVNDADAFVAPAASVTVTLYVVTALVAVAVPLMRPVVVLKARPVGRVPVSAYVFVPVPPVTTGVCAAIAVPTVAVNDV